MQKLSEPPRDGIRFVRLRYEKLFLMCCIYIYNYATTESAYRPLTGRTAFGHHANNFLTEKPAQAKESNKAVTHISSKHITAVERWNRDTYFSWYQYRESSGTTVVLQYHKYCGTRIRYYHTVPLYLPTN